MINDKIDDLFGEDESFFDETETESEETNEQSEENVQEVQEITDDDMQDVFKETTTKQDEAKDVGEQNKSSIKNNKTKQNRQNVNNSQDIVDENGNIIAKAGAERRFYEENQRMKRDLDNFNRNILPKIKQDYTNMQNEIASYKGMIEGLKANDLSVDEIQSGLDFVRNWKKNPENVVKYLLTNLQSSGKNIDIEGISNQSQTEAIKRMIDEKFEPFIKEREERQQREQYEREAEEEYNNFIQKHPDSVIHDNTLAYMINRNPEMPLEVAYLQLKNYYLEHNLDFKVPLKYYAERDTIHEKVKQRQNTKPSVQGLPKNPTVSANVLTKNTKSVAKLSDSYKDIIKSVLGDAF